jgi:hypothetical protein
MLSPRPAMRSRPPQTCCLTRISPLRRLLTCLLVLTLTACGAAGAEGIHTKTDAPASSTTTTVDNPIDWAKVEQLANAVQANQLNEFYKAAFWHDVKVWVDGLVKLQQEAAAARHFVHHSSSSSSGCHVALIPASRPCVNSYCNRESNMTVNAQNCKSSASGKYQILDSTWNNYGGYQHAKDAPESVQDDKASSMPLCNWQPPNYCA